jgi:hypothetical protein
MRRRRGRISGAVAGAYGAASGGGSGSTSSSTEASHGHGRAVVGSSSSSGGQARHAPLWARHGTLSAALLLKDSLCVVHLFEVARRTGTTLSSPPTTAPKPPGAVSGAEVARAVPGAEVAASVTPLVNFGRVHVSLLLRCVPPSARAVAGAEQEHAARLSLRLLAQLLRHSLESPNGWQLLPLLHHLFNERANTPALTSHVLLLLGCRLLASIEAQLKAGELPPFAAPDSRGHSGELPRPSMSAASSAQYGARGHSGELPRPGAASGAHYGARGHSGELPRPGAASSTHYGARTSWSHEASPSASCSGECH